MTRRVVSDEARAKNTAWHARNKERLAPIRKARMLAEPEKVARIARNSALKANYGITIDEYDNMFRVQGGKCAICQNKQGRTLHVDHCHRTSIVRGLLCQKCNMAIGLLSDDTKILQRAINYLKVDKT